MPTRNNAQQPQQLSVVLPAFIVLLGGIVGGSLGLLIGMQGDQLLHVDSGIVGAVLGAILGSVLPRLRRPLKAVHLGSATLGVLVPVLGFIGIQRVALEVLVSMTTVAVLGSAILVTILNSFRNKYK